MFISLHLHPNTFQVSDDTEEQPLNSTAGTIKRVIPTPAARSCCGNVAYTVGKNAADAQLKTGETSAATQHFNNIEKEKNNNKKSIAGCCIQ